jgi:hypothetical protein
MIIKTKMIAHSTNYKMEHRRKDVDCWINTDKILYAYEMGSQTKLVFGDDSCFEIETREWARILAIVYDIKPPTEII